MEPDHKRLYILQKLVVMVDRSTKVKMAIINDVLLIKKYKLNIIISFIQQKNK